MINATTIINGLASRRANVPYAVFDTATGIRFKIFVEEKTGRHQATLADVMDRHCVGVFTRPADIRALKDLRKAITAELADYYEDNQDDS